MQVLLRAPRISWVFVVAALAGVALFGFSTGVLMLPHAPPIGDRMAELTCFQLAFSGERATAIVLSFPPEARQAIARLLIPGDVTFAWSYGLLLTGLLGLLARRLSDGWLRAGAVFIWLPLVASALDCVEDVLLHRAVTLLIDDPAASVPALLPAAAGLAASLKYFCLSILTPGFAIAGSLRGLTCDRTPSALVVYLLASLVATSMFVRFAQQLPACF